MFNKSLDINMESEFVVAETSSKPKIRKVRTRKGKEKQQADTIYVDPKCTLDDLQPAIDLLQERLTEPQKEVLQECINKGNGGLSVPMGSGKTIIALALALYYAKQYKQPALVVVSKTLLTGWNSEIAKFLGEKLKYQILHSDHMNVLEYPIDNDTPLVITTPEVLAKLYKHYEVANVFIRYEERHHRMRMFQAEHIVKIFNPVDKPLLNYTVGGGLMYSSQWSCLIVDEVQKMLNSDTQSCQGIASISATHRWLLSGTMLYEPKARFVLGYYLILNDKTFPRCLPDVETFIITPRFKGMKETMVYRDKPLSYTDFTLPSVNQDIIAVDFTPEEVLLYTSVKNIMKKLNACLKQAKATNDRVNVRKFNSYLLSMIMYLRQTLICPLLPFASAMIDMSSMKNKSLLSEIIINEFRSLGLEDYVNDKKNAISSRLKKCIELLHKHCDERVVVFCTFRSCLELLRVCIPEGRNVYIIDSSTSIAKRQEVFRQFNEDSSCILLLTYDLGSEGLNLQSGYNVMLLDFWWNAGKTEQAIARVLRPGQQSDLVNVYFFTSNTGIEKEIFKKQRSKQNLIQELMNGNIRTHRIEKINVHDIIRMFDSDTNVRSLEDINSKMKILKL